MLKGTLAKQLYDCVKELPIIDYHNHLSMTEIAENKRFEDIYGLWIQPDPYKHRAMRMCGVEERCITGDAPTEDKFRAWCSVFPELKGSPLYLWSLAELKFLGIDLIPNGENWVEIWKQASSYLQSHKLTVSALLKAFRVEYACPCASLTDDLSVFAKRDNLAPSLRGDTILVPDSKLLADLATETGIAIVDLESFQQAVAVRLQAFHQEGCRFSDHGLDNGFVYVPDDGGNAMRFQKILAGETLDGEESQKFASGMLLFLGQEYAKLGFVMQLHMGAQRYTSTRLRELAGPAGGFAGIGNSISVDSLTTFFDGLEQTGYLPKTMVFPLNPADNALVSVLSGSYSKDGVKGLITQGPAWWWCDHAFGIRQVLDNVSSFGLLSNFVGMTTDSRSFLSLVRHDYFRRILCSWMAEKAETGELPDSVEELSPLLKKICYENARESIRGEVL